MRFFVIIFIFFTILWGREETLLVHEFSISNPITPSTLRLIPIITENVHLRNKGSLNAKEREAILESFKEISTLSALNALCKPKNPLLEPQYSVQERKNMGYRVTMPIHCLFRENDKTSINRLMEEIEQNVSKNPLLEFQLPQTEYLLTHTELNLLKEQAYSVIMTQAVAKVREYSKIMDKRCYLKNLTFLPPILRTSIEPAVSSKTNHITSFFAESRILEYQAEIPLRGDAMQIIKAEATYFCY
ncbi:hypothetical protein CCZ01_03830 [Helicobacter monodelphidis]|uniref:hypothetical protein n=1 Tax=Helicobacter sp. 15-1451 TaxID=2004995 RepID=UPI000DCCD67D|nr:hypothetical protein [Helicobacter sp. 15-1451]RAX58212.1 hypothetical protein CCZ01_03830 [Helicobacter sp. 15-1451]